MKTATIERLINAVDVWVATGVFENTVFSPITDDAKEELKEIVEAMEGYKNTTKIILPSEEEIDSMQLEIDLASPLEQEYTANGFKSGVRWLKNTIERQMLGDNKDCKDFREVADEDWARLSGLDTKLEKW
jgi:hypothetical protein